MKEKSKILILGFHLVFCIIYLILSIFFAGGGHGSFLPYGILFGFGSIPWMLSPNVASFFVFPVGLFAVYALFFLKIFDSSSYLKMTVFWMIFQGIGSVLAGLLIISQWPENYITMDSFKYLIMSLILLVLYQVGMLFFQKMMKVLGSLFDDQ